MTHPRLLSKSELTNYLGHLPWREIEAKMTRGQLPKPLWNVEATNKNARLDKNAVDRALDRLSSAPSSITAQTQELDHAFGTFAG